MSIYKLVIFFICFHAYSVFASTLDCEPSTSGPQSDWVSIHTNIELKPANVQITIGSNLSDWQLIYELDNIVFGRVYSTCNGWDDSQYTLLTSETPVRVSGNDIIFKTNVPGIGISVYDDKGHGISAFPTTNYGWDSPAQGASYIMSVKYWKIPGENIPMESGTLSVTGPEVAGLLGGATGWSISSNYADRVLHGNYDYYLNSSRILQGTLIFQPGTCDVAGDNVNVDLGDYDGSNGHSAWKDASFKLICPDAWGYGGSANAQSNANYPYQLSPDAKITPNNVLNGQVQISIVPLNNGAIDPNRGIIALDGTGAQGYGIQLAWGDYSTQNVAEPADPVILNNYIDVHSLNSAFRAGETKIGENAFTGGDNTIKMAARYIRTSGDTAPGPANAVVQVIATYQ
ncbi:TPA: hypothetical protein RUS85_002593 [Citrobacter amalonaticus]|nr:hypothetical protein [Citrobacter amalonaticus]